MAKASLLLCCVLASAIIFEVFATVEFVELDALNSSPDALLDEKLMEHNGRYFNHNQQTQSAHKIKNCDNKKMKISQELNKLKNVVIKCQAVNPGVKYAECESSIEKIYIKKRELQSKLKKCTNGLMEINTDLGILEEALGECEGKNRILTPQISELNTKHVQLTNLAAKHQNELNRCRSRAFNNCRETEQKCNTQCAATSSKSSKSSKSSHHSHKPHKPHHPQYPSHSIGK